MTCLRANTAGQRRFWRLPKPDEDRGSLPILMLAVLVGLTMSALLVPMVINQSRSTRFEISRVHSLHAAESGFDVALGLVRSAVSTGSTGDTTKLPCGPLTGNVNGSADAQYSVAIAYYIADPGTKDATWLANNKMKCVSGYGPYDPTTKTYTPSFVLLTSTGTDGTALGSSSGRTLQTTYVVKTTNSNITGGQIRIFPSGADNYCLDAGSSPAVNSFIYLQPCSTSVPLAPQQVWSYNSDLSLQLMSTVGNTTLNPNGNGLCLDANTPHAAGNKMYLSACAPPKNATYDLQWSIDDSSHFEGAKSDKSDIDGYCVNADTQTANQLVTLQPCAGGVTDTKQTWVPTPSVGVGAAGAPDPPPAGWISTPHQLVNFYQFGRCMDVTNTDVTSSFLIAYPCKQNPNPSKVLWNQKWAYNSSKEWVTNNGSAYCLNSPRTNGAYVTLVACPSSPTSAVTWTNNLTQDATGQELPYAKKFTMVDSAGLCLSLSSSSDTYNGQYYKVTVATCDGSTPQKWNAQPYLQTPTVQNTKEK
jgi:hypothetical protein